MKPRFLNIAAFSLVEVTLAIAVSAFCLIAIFGLLPAGIRSNQTAVEQTAANGILSAVSADLRAAPSEPGSAVTTQQFGIQIPGSPATESAATLYFTGAGKCLPDSSGTDIRYRLSVRFLPNGTGAPNATFVSLQVSWPAVAEPAEAAGSSTMFLAIDRN